MEEIISSSTQNQEEDCKGCLLHCQRVNKSDNEFTFNPDATEFIPSSSGLLEVGAPHVKQTFQAPVPLQAFQMPVPQQTFWEPPPQRQSTFVPGCQQPSYRDGFRTLPTLPLFEVRQCTPLQQQMPGLPLLMDPQGQQRFYCTDNPSSGLLRPPSFSPAPYPAMATRVSSPCVNVFIPNVDVIGCGDRDGQNGVTTIPSLIPAIFPPTSDQEDMQ